MVVMLEATEHTCPLKCETLEILFMPSNTEYRFMDRAPGYVTVRAQCLFEVYVLSAATKNCCLALCCVTAYQLKVYNCVRLKFERLMALFSHQHIAPLNRRWFWFHLPNNDTRTAVKSTGAAVNPHAGS